MTVLNREKQSEDCATHAASIAAATFARCSHAVSEYVRDLTLQFRITIELELVLYSFFYVYRVFRKRFYKIE